MLSRLEWGITNPLLVRREAVPLGLGRQVLYISDIHLRPSNNEDVTREILQVVKAEEPSLILLGGDLADRRASLTSLTNLVANMGKYCPVAATSGNHDTLVGVSQVRGAVVKGGGVWLPDATFQWGEVQIVSRVDQAISDRATILCCHYPTDFQQAYGRGIKLVLAGHLHGWQIVLWERGEYLYPGAWLSRWNGLRFERSDSTMLVSRGVTDLFPLRWNCPREVILVSS